MTPNIHQIVMGFRRGTTRMPRSLPLIRGSLLLIRGSLPLLRGYEEFNTLFDVIANVEVKMRFYWRLGCWAADDSREKNSERCEAKSTVWQGTNQEHCYVMSTRHMHPNCNAKGQGNIDPILHAATVPGPLMSPSTYHKSLAMWAAQPWATWLAIVWPCGHEEKDLGSAKFC